MAADDLNQRLQDLKFALESPILSNWFHRGIERLSRTCSRTVETRDYASNMEQRIRMLQQTIEQALLEQGRISERQDAQFE